MRILLIGFFTLLAGCAVEATSSPVTTPQGYGVSQEFTGSYTCPQGLTNVDLRVLSNPYNQTLQYAIFLFGPPGTDLNNDPQGSYLMNGTFDLTRGNLELQPVSWIKEPLFFTMVGMSGNSEDGGATFSGTINSPGCGNFELSNIANSSSPPNSEASPGAVPAQDQPTTAQQADTDHQVEAAAAQDQATAARVSALFVAFQDKTVDPGDHIAPLLNYTSFGSDAGSSNAFWARKGNSSSVYIEYGEGDSVQRPVKNLQEIDVSKIDPSTLYIQQQSGSVVILFGMTTFSTCPTCSESELQSRWISFFQPQRK